MATKHVFLTGKGKWVKVYLPNDFGKYSLDLYMDADNIAKFKAMKVKNWLRKDEQGEYVTFSRPVEQKIKGKMNGMGRPRVIDAEGKPLEDTPIGHGSDLIVDLEHYSYKRMGQEEFACRLAGVKVMNLVPWDKQKDLLEDQVESYDKLNEQTITWN